MSIVFSDATNRNWKNSLKLITFINNAEETICYFGSLTQFFWSYHSVPWKNEKFSLHQKKIFRQINSFVKPLLSRNFSQKCVRENSLDFHCGYNATKNNFIKAKVVLIYFTIKPLSTQMHMLPQFYLPISLFCVILY